MPTATKKKRTRRSTALPNWGDLAGPKGDTRRTAGFLAGLSTLRFALLVLVMAGSCALYVGHVHATQALLSQVARVRAENQRLHLKKNRLQSAFDRATAPSVVYRRAEKMGLRQGLSRGPTIYVGDIDAHSN